MSSNFYKSYNAEGKALPVAQDTPGNIASMILHSGYGQVGAWYHHVSDGGFFFNKNASLFGLSEQEFSTLRGYTDLSGHSEPPFLLLQPHSLLTFCRNIGVHPAHLVPLNDNPRLSLETSIYQANLFILNDPMESRVNKELAATALIVEAERYQKFMGDSNWAFMNKLGVMKIHATRCVNDKGFMAGVSNVFSDAAGKRQGKEMNFFSLLLENLSIEATNKYNAFYRGEMESEARYGKTEYLMEEAYKKFFGDTDRSIEEFGLMIDQIYDANDSEGYVDKPLEEIKKECEGGMDQDDDSATVPDVSIEKLMGCILMYRNSIRDTKLTIGQLDNDEIVKLRELARAVSDFHEAADSVCEFEISMDEVALDFKSVHEEVGEAISSGTLFLSRLFANRYTLINDVTGGFPHLEKLYGHNRGKESVFQAPKNG